MVESARQNVLALFLVGLVLAAAGAVLSVIAWPSPEQEGSLVLGVAMLALASAGGLMTWVALIAWGVRLGVESAARN